MSRFLKMLGIHVMTNREAIMEELDQASVDDFPRYLNEAVDVINAAPPGWLSAICRVEQILNPEKEEHHA